MNGLIVPENLKGSLWDFLTSTLLPIIKKCKGTLWRHHKILAKSLTKQKKGGKSQSVKTVKQGDFLLWIGFLFQVRRLDYQWPLMETRLPVLFFHKPYNARTGTSSQNTGGDTFRLSISFPQVTTGSLPKLNCSKNSKILLEV